VIPEDQNKTPKGPGDCNGFHFGFLYPAKFLGILSTNKNKPIAGCYIRNNAELKSCNFL
jgi:hypothetical protein